MIRNLIYDAIGTRCEYCKEFMKLETISFDHAKAKTMGGSWLVDNLSIICFRCNRRKGNLNKDAFVALLGVADQYEVKSLLLAKLGYAWRVSDRRK